MTRDPQRRSPSGWSLRLRILCAVLIAAAASGVVGAPSGVPSERRALYATLTEWLDGFDRANADRGCCAASAPTFAAHLLAADANRGPALLEPGALAGVDATLDRFASLGVQGIALVIGYPMLLDLERAEEYRAFYRGVARSVRKRGMSLLVEHNVLFLDSEFSPFSVDLSNFSFAQFASQQHRMAQILIDDLRPDYLTILHEPQTFAALTGLEAFHEPSQARAYVDTVLAGLERRETKVGAGAANYDDLRYAKQLVASGVDYLSLNLYMVDPGSVERAFAVADLARAAGKPFVLTEGWLYKSDGRDLAAQASLAGWEEGFRRDAFDFWEPLDERFLRAFTCFARTTGAAFAAPYWTNYFFAYVPADARSRTRSYRELVTVMAPARVAAAITAGFFTGTGTSYRSLLRDDPDCA